MEPDSIINHNEYGIPENPIFPVSGGNQQFTHTVYSGMHTLTGT